jgi:SAM-dependent methyltransferase
MRAENLSRLSSTNVKLKDPNYLSYKFLFLELKTAIDKYASGKVLDIGCGNKPYKDFFEKKIESYTGCDMIQSDKNEVDIICPATEIPLAQNTMDTVFSTQVIEHVADHGKMLAEAYRILKPGGYLILSGPMYWEHHEVPFDFFRFTRYGFEYILQKEGFTNLIITPCGGKWAFTGQVLLNSFRTSFAKKSVFRKIMKTLFSVFLVKYFINIMFGWLDKKDFDDITCLNFVVVAQKNK